MAQAVEHLQSWVQILASPKMKKEKSYSYHESNTLIIIEQ
jgi:hypothetical protein